MLYEDCGRSFQLAATSSLSKDPDIVQNCSIVVANELEIQGRVVGNVNLSVAKDPSQVAGRPRIVVHGRVEIVQSSTSGTNGDVHGP